MAALAMTAAAQGVDPASYAAKEGYQLENLWLMSAGNGENGVAMGDWAEVTSHMANPGKATMATILGDKVYIACSQSYVDAVDENGQPYQALDHFGHLVVLDAATGKFEKELVLTLDGKQYEGLLCCNSIGHDNFGHLWTCGYVQPTYDDATNVAKPMKLYMINPETGEMTLVNEFMLDEIEGPGHGARVDYYDVIGDLTGQQARAVFMACPNEINFTYAWALEQGATEWGMQPDEYICVQALDTDPANQTAWNYSPMVSIVADDEFNGDMYYVDGHTTRPALYDREGEMVESLAGFQELEEWADFMPNQQANGVRQMRLNGVDFLGYAIKFPDDKDMGGQIALIKLDENGSTENAVPMWTMPEGKLGIRKGEGRFSHTIDYTPEYTDANGKHAINILIYKDMNGVGLYRLAEEGFVAGVNDVIADSDANAPVEYFNLNGVRVQGELVPGLYITRQGNNVNKVVVK